MRINPFTGAKDQSTGFREMTGGSLSPEECKIASDAVFLSLEKGSKFCGGVRTDHPDFKDVSGHFVVKRVINGNGGLENKRVIAIESDQAHKWIPQTYEFARRDLHFLSNG